MEAAKLSPCMSAGAAFPKEAMPPSISLAMIARNRAKELSRCLSIVSPHVDEIIVVGAGESDDDTLDVARSFGAKVIEFTPKTNPEAFYTDDEKTFEGSDIPGPFSGKIGLGDFAAPRNLSFAHCTQDYIFWLDSDDVIENPEKLPFTIEKMEQRGADAVFMYYEYDFDADDRCITKQIRERIIRKKAFDSGRIKWEQPIHEHLRGPDIKNGLLFENIHIKHRPTNEGSSITKAGDLTIHTIHRDTIHYRNLKCLFLEQKRCKEAGEEMNFRYDFYFGTEMRAVDPEKAIEHFETYIKNTVWDEERAQARFYIGHLREMQMRGEEAWNYYAGAAADFSENPMSHFGLARIAFVRGQWKKVIEFTENGFKYTKEIRKPTLIVNPFEWQYRAHLCYSRALIEVGRLDDAEASCNAGLKLQPDCPFLREHKAMIAERRKKEEAA